MCSCVLLFLVFIGLMEINKIKIKWCDQCCAMCIALQNKFYCPIKRLIVNYAGDDDGEKISSSQSGPAKRYFLS